LNEGRTVYFHCSQGKDRAGFAAYLIEIALGVPEEKAREDYLLTNLAMKEKIASLTKRVEDKPFFNEKFRQDLIDIFSAKEEYLDESIRLMKERYGGTMNYIQKVVGVDMERLRKLYLD
jgi:protein-tyrosine phosphatase